MGDVVALPRTPARNSFSPWNGIRPTWPHPRQVTITIEHARAIDRDIRHLDAVMERARDIEAISTILSTICGAERAARPNGHGVDRAHPTSCSKPECAPRTVGRDAKCSRRRKSFRCEALARCRSVLELRPSKYARVRVRPE